MPICKTGNWPDKPRSARTCSRYGPAMPVTMKPTGETAAGSGVEPIGGADADDPVGDAEPPPPNVDASAAVDRGMIRFIPSSRAAAMVLACRSGISSSCCQVRGGRSTRSRFTLWVSSAIFWRWLTAGLYVGYIVTTVQADGGGTVICRKNQFPAVNQRQKIALDTQSVNLDRVLLPPRTWQHELEIPDRHARTIAAARELGMNRIIPRSTAAEASTFGGGGSASPTGSSASAPPMGSTPDPAAVSPVGFIVTGMAGPYLEHVLADLGLSGQFPVLQMGMSYPVDVQIVAEFSALCRDMIVIEERRSFLEKNIRD